MANASSGHDLALRRAGMASDVYRNIVTDLVPSRSSSMPKRYPSTLGINTNANVDGDGTSIDTTTTTTTTPLDTHSGDSTPTSDQYLPGLDFSRAVSDPLSPTLGMTESEWRAIPFTARRKLKQAVMLNNPASQQTVATASMPIPMAKTRSGADSSAASAASSVRSSESSASGTGRSLERTTSMFLPRDPKPIPFSQRQKQRASTLSTPSASAAASPGTSATGSPAMLFLSKLSLVDSTSSPSSLDRAMLEDSQGQALTQSQTQRPQRVGKYTIGRMIGYGSFSQVKEAIHTDPESGKRIVGAVKIVRKSNPDAQDATLARAQCEFVHEVAIWKQLVHPNVLRLHEMIDNDDDSCIYCFTDHITGGTLFDVVKQARQNNYASLSNTLIHQYISQLASALEYLHCVMKIVHRDVKLENCLVEESPGGQSKVVLCDFGMSEYYYEPSDAQDVPLIGPSDNAAIISRAHYSRSDDANDNDNDKPNTNNSVAATPAAGHRRRPSVTLPSTLSAESTSHFGSLPYASPELLRSSVPVIDPAVDIWALGVVVYAMYMGRLPWQHVMPPKLRSMVLEAAWDRASVTTRAGDQITLLLDRCLDPDTGTRANIQQVLVML